MKRNLLTNRLKLVPVYPNDINLIFSFLRNDNIKKYLCDNKDIEEVFVKNFIKKSESLFEEKDIGLWLIKFLNNSLSIGFCGFFKDNLLELIFVVHPEFQNCGYATEAVSKVIRYYNQLKLNDEVFAKIDNPNLASHRVISKLSLIEFGEEKNLATGGVMKIYKLL